MEAKEEKTIRIATVNVHTFPIMGRDPCTHDVLKHEIIKGEYDYIGLSETNYNWTKMESKEQIHHQTRGWWKNKTIQRSWLRTDKNTKHQIGGTASIATNDMTSYKEASGEDKRELGRWSWITIKDPTGEIKTTIVTLYSPCHNRGTITAYTQQLQAIRETEPMNGKGVYEHYIHDLQELLKEKKEKNHQLIIMGDFNEDTRENGKIVRLLKKFKLRNPIEDKYGKATSTYAYGERPIDAIFTEENITIHRGGHKQGNLAMSDHKIVWIDIPTYDILGVTEPIIRPPYRKLQAHHPKVKQRYNQELEKQLKHNNAEKLIQQMTQAIKEKKPEIYQNIYEKLDRIRRQAVRHAEKKCTKERRGEIAFSPEITKAIGAITMWKLIYKRETNKGRYKPRWKMLKRKAKRWKFKRSQLYCKHIPTITKQLGEAIRYYRVIRKDARTLRNSYLEEKADTVAAEKGIDKGKYLTHLIRIEEMKETHKAIRHSQKPQATTSLTFIEDGTDQGPRTKITEKEAMETAIRIANIEKLTQADNTPLREEPLATLFGERSLDFQTWEKVLDPTVPLPDNLERGTSLWFKQMRRQETNIKPTKLHHNEDTYRSSWKHIKEAKSSHPGLHFGHFKAMDKESCIANKVHAILADVPMQTGYSPEQWQKCTNAMLKKKANDMRPGKLRLITLMDAVFNHNNKLIGKQMMRNGEKHNLIAIEQYGSRKHKSAIDHALNKVLTLDISRQKREALIFTANDARSCYDRIVLLAAYCTMIKFGIPRTTAQSTIATLAKMAHYIRTAKGDSTRTYGGTTWVRIPHGIGQGNGAGPSIWACVSTPLFDALRQEGYGMEFISPITTLIMNITGFSFVDDADLIQNMGDMTSEEELFIAAQAQLILWEELLRTTGGAIEPSKSDWLYIRYKWKSSRWEYNRTKYKDEMKVRNKDKENEQLRQLTISEARETLGVWIAGDGNWREQCKQLEKKARQWATNLNKGHLNHTKTTIAVQTTIMKSLEYCLPATTMTKNQCNKVMKALLPSTLPRMKVVRSINRDAVQLPIEYNGLGIRDLHTTQGIEHIKAMIQHGGRNTATGILLQTSLEYHSIEAGSIHPIFTLPNTMIQYLTKTWIRHTLQFMKQHNIKITNQQGTPQQWTNNDRGIMDIIVQSNKYTTDELQAINTCRMYLQVMTTSDITDNKGELIKEAWHLHKYQSTSARAYRWPNQANPTTQDIHTWRHALQHTLKLQTFHKNQHHQYKAMTAETQSIHDWRYDKDTKQLWKKQKETWRRWEKYNRRRKIVYNETDEESNTSLRKWELAIIRESNEGVHLLHTTIATTVTQKKPQNSTWVPLGQINEGEALDSFKDQLRYGTAGCVSDGSAKDGHTATAYKALHQEDHTPAINGQFSIPGRFEEQDSYRSELAGLLGIITTVNFLCILHKITQGTITVGCDNKSALHTAFHTNHIGLQRSSRDILQALHHQRTITPLTWKTRHVKGHQDDVTTELDEWELANVNMDEHAKLQRSTEHSTPNHTYLEGETWRLHLHTLVITGKYTQSLETHCNYTRAVNYWSRRGQFVKAQHKNINWKAHNTAAKRLPTNIRLHLTKLYAGVQATGKVMHRRNQWRNNQCPMCTTTEDHEHILKCTSAQAHQHFLQAYGDLDEWLEKTTSTEIGQAVYLLIDDYRTDAEDTFVYDNWSPTLQSTVQQQRHIGPRSFNEGYLALGWVAAQEEHYMLTNNRQASADRWVTRLHGKIWKYTHSMWTQRCTYLHSKETQDKLHNDDHNSELTYLLRHPPPLSMPAEDRKYFIPITTALKYPIRRKTRLIQLLKTFNEAHLQRTNNPSANLMRNWLANLEVT